MGDDTIDLARSTRWAWKGLHERFVERLELLDPGDSIRLTGQVGAEECSVSVRRAGDVLIAETADECAPDAGPTTADRWRRELRSLGWVHSSRGHRHHRFQVDRRSVDRVAHLCIATLRDVHGVLHPAFLEGDLQTAEDPLLPRVTERETQKAPAATFPLDRAELEALVRATLTADLDQPLKVDQDGDVPFAAGTAVVFVRVLERVPAIRLFAELVVDIADADHAAREVERLNREHPEVKFLLLDDRIHCERDLDAWPYAPQHLRSALTHLCDLCSRIDGEVAERVRGRRFLEPPERSASFPPDLELLLSGDPLRTRPRAELISALCGEDLGQLRQWLRRAYEDQEGAADRLQEAVVSGAPGLRGRERDYETASRSYRRLVRALRYALRNERSSRR